jgi:heme-degrading monooxygenase HmoA
MTHLRIWQFRPPPEQEDAFAKAYAGVGAWAALFARDPGYRGTELIRPDEPGGWWRTVDRWETAEAFARFEAEHGEDYRALDRELSPLAGEERFVGAFDD